MYQLSTVHKTVKTQLSVSVCWTGKGRKRRKNKRRHSMHVPHYIFQLLLSFRGSLKPYALPSLPYSTHNVSAQTCLIKSVWLNTHLSYHGFLGTAYSWEYAALVHWCCWVRSKSSSLLCTGYCRMGSNASRLLHTVDYYYFIYLLVSELSQISLGFFLHSLAYLFWDRVLICSLAWPWTLNSPGCHLCTGITGVHHMPCKTIIK